MLSPGGAKREWTTAGPARGQEGGSDSEAGQPEKGQTVISPRVAPWEVTAAFLSFPGMVLDEVTACFLPPRPSPFLALAQLSVTTRLSDSHTPN